jgi:hypothetical protein
MKARVGFGAPYRRWKRGCGRVPSAILALVISLDRIGEALAGKLSLVALYLPANAFRMISGAKTPMTDVPLRHSCLPRRPERADRET